MTIIFVALLLIVFISSRTSNHITVKGTDYLSKNYTDAMKGFFILLVFLSHIKGYYKFTSPIDEHYMIVQSFMSQGIVTFFLFISGYGVFLGLKKKENYVETFLSKRIFGVVWEFELALLFFVVLQTFFLHRDIFNINLLWSMLAWKGIGNSNWYIFCIIVLYLFVYVVFALSVKEKITDDKLKRGITLVSILSLVYMVAMHEAKPYWWYDTALCFPMGMWYGFYKEKIDTYLDNNKNKLFILVVCILVVWFSYLNRNTIYIRTFFNLSFVLFFVLYMKLFYIKSNFLSYLGQNLFGIYILERLPMMYFKHINLFENQYVYILACFIATLLLNELFKVLLVVSKKNIFIKAWEVKNKR